MHWVSIHTSIIASGAVKIDSATQRSQVLCYWYVTLIIKPGLNSLLWERILSVLFQYVLRQSLTHERQLTSKKTLWCANSQMRQLLLGIRGLSDTFLFVKINSTTFVMETVKRIAFRTRAVGHQDCRVSCCNYMNIPISIRLVRVRDSSTTKAKVST